MFIFRLCICIATMHLSTAAFFDPKTLTPETPVVVQEEAVRSLIERAIGVSAIESFEVVVNKSLPFRSFEIVSNQSKRNTIIISGWDGVAVAKGFHHYMKYYLHKDVSWTNTSMELPATIFLPNVTIASTSASPLIYYQNVCTWSYSFAWWTWSTWRRHIDWMAMMGISLTIAPIQEQIWHELYVQMGLTEMEIDDYFAGPAFQAWQRMGNIRGWAGPLPASYRRMQLLLQRKVVEAQRDLGMTVALPAFAGHVPTALQRLHPNATLTAVERWNHFPDTYCCSLFVEPNQPLFREIAAAFLRVVVANYGSNHIYFCDPFNEIQPRLAEADYLRMTAHHIYNSLRSVDAAAVWLLQGWMFVKNPFWTDTLIKAFLTAVPTGRLLVLDLQSEQFPQYERTHSYHGQPFIWCMLHNFGGTLGMHGSAALVNTRIGAARRLSNSSMIGVGITPEGIHQNYVMYALTLERAWLQLDIELDAWFGAFARARYGSDEECLPAAWQLLQQSVYDYQGLRKQRGKYTITRRPAMNLEPWSWYNASSVHAAWTLLLQANASAMPQSARARYEHDVVDVTRQFLQLLADRLYVNLISAYKKRQAQRLAYIADQLLMLFDDLEQILATNEFFLLGPWLASAKRMADNDSERRLFEINARNQITAWGPRGQILDYACKQWSGLVRDYYKPRWALFLHMVQQSLTQNARFNNTAFKLIVSNEIENPFSIQLTRYPEVPNGKTLPTAEQIYKRWSQQLNEHTFSHYVRLYCKVFQ